MHQEPGVADVALHLESKQADMLTNTYSLHCSSFLGLPFWILNTKLIKTKKGTTTETISNMLNRLCQQFLEP